MIYFSNLIHTISPYSARWGGPRYETIKFTKFLNKHLYKKQEVDLAKEEKINTVLIPEAFLSSNCKPLYLKSIKYIGFKKAFVIKDEIGFEASFPEGTEILIYKNNDFIYEKIENIKPGDFRVINFESEPELKNYQSDVNKDFLSIACNTEEEIQKLMCDYINSFVILKKTNHNSISKIDSFDKKENIQEIYLLEVKSITCPTNISSAEVFELEFLPFSCLLLKNIENSNCNNNRYYNEINKKRSKNYLNKMKNKVFNIEKSDKFNIKMELRNEKDYY
jgi:hypothetical protein